MESSNVWAQYQSRHTDRAISNFLVNDASVRVLFELGRSEINRGAVETLKAFDVINVSSASNDEIHIVVNGRRIGRGAQTSIGNKIGVQVTRL